MSTTKPLRKRSKSLLSKMLVVLGVVALMLTHACQNNPKKETPADPPPVAEEATPKDDAATFAWANAIETPPPGYSGPVFELSHDYPDQMPQGDPMTEFPWLSIPVDFNASSVE